MNPMPFSHPFAIAGEHIKPGAFFRDVFGRVNRRNALQTGLIGFLFSLYNAAYWAGAEGQSLHFFLIAHLPINLGGAYFVLIALLCGDSAVACGAKPVWAYLLPLGLAALLFGYLQWQIHVWWVAQASPDIREAEIVVDPAQLYQVALDVLRTGGVIAFVYINRRLAETNLRQLQSARLQREEGEKGIVHSRLLAMQARVEPKLLSDTLRQVGALYKTQPKSADVLLENLITYLRAALPELREPASTFRRERVLARAYFGMLGCARRLSCVVEATEEAGAASMPPMLLLPLMNHVLAQGPPIPEPAALYVSALVQGRRLRVLVELNPLTTVGHATSFDRVPAPTDIEERLQALYGTDATLNFESPPKASNHSPIRWILEIPYEANAPARTRAS